MFSGQATQYLDASVVVVSKTNAVQGVVDYKCRSFGERAVMHSGDVVSRTTHTVQHDIEINLRSLEGVRQAARELTAVLQRTCKGCTWSSLGIQPHSVS